MEAFIMFILNLYVASTLAAVGIKLAKEYFANKRIEKNGYKITKGDREVQEVVYDILKEYTYCLVPIRNIKKSLNTDLEIEGIVATMYDSRTNLSQQVLDEVKKHFPDKVFSTPIPRNVRLSEAPSYGQPIIKYDITSKGAEAYFALAREVINNNKEWSNG